MQQSLQRTGVANISSARKPSPFFGKRRTTTEASKAAREQPANLLARHRSQLKQLVYATSQQNFIKDLARQRFLNHQLEPFQNPQALLQTQNSLEDSARGNQSPHSDRRAAPTGKIENFYKAYGLTKQMSVQSIKLEAKGNSARRYENKPQEDFEMPPMLF